jgi:ribonucleoside-diphosphate reductase alpha chain
MHVDRFKKHLPSEDIDTIKWAFQQVKDKHIVPSMRSMQFGGKAVLAHNARIYNCAVRHVDSIRSFAEIFYLLLCGCGVGIGVSKHFIDRFPDIVTAKDKTGTVVTYVVEDSIEGWSDSIEALLNSYFRNTAFSGRKIVFDFSKIRPKGTPLETAGGKAPGYQGLKRCHQKVKELFDYIIEQQNQTRLKSINAYDILMHCADAVLSGGIRRSATSLIFDKDDEEMMNAKTFFDVTRHTKFYHDDETDLYVGKITVNKKKYEVELIEYEYNEVLKNKRISWVHIEPQRARSNNSVLLLRDETTFEEFTSILNKTRQFGEPGFVFGNHPWQLYNPCFEIGFIPVTKDGVCGVQFCNLTSINGAKIDTKSKFLDAVKASTIVGTLQAAYSEFNYLRPASKQLTEGEALLGVSITGIMDNPKILLNPDYQREGATYAVKVNKSWAKKLNVNQAARITCIKPEGTSSLVLGSASGIHPHHSKRYFRRIQCNKLDPVYKHFKKSNKHMCEESVWSANKTDDVVTFPVQVSKHAMVKDDLTALQHLKWIKTTQQNWVMPGTTEANINNIEHNVSCTVVVKDDEWDRVFKFLYDNKKYFGAVALLPKIGDKLYAQAPLESILDEKDEERWHSIVDKYVAVNYKVLKEKEDTTEVQDTVACGGGACEIPTLQEVKVTVSEAVEA